VPGGGDALGELELEHAITIAAARIDPNEYAYFCMIHPFQDGGWRRRKP
jgi:hypothetical protein